MCISIFILIYGGVKARISTAGIYNELRNMNVKGNKKGKKDKNLICMHYVYNPK